MGFEFVLLAVASFLIGFLVKFVDLIEDEPKLFKKYVVLKKISFQLGLFYGLLLVLVLVAWPILIPLAIGTIFGEIISRKIDAWGHVAALAIFIILCFVLVSLGEMEVGINFSFISLIILFFAASLVDELADKYAEAKELKKSLSTLLSFRPFLEITAIVVSLLLGQWMIWVTVISFDLAYILATRVVPKMLSKN